MLTFVLMLCSGYSDTLAFSSLDALIHISLSKDVRKKKGGGDKILCINYIAILEFHYIVLIQYYSFFTVTPSQFMAFQGKKYFRQTRFCQLPSHYAVTSEQNER